MKKTNKSRIKMNMEDIAKKAKVSKMTVSRAINQPQNVSKSTLLKIRKIINKTNFSINQTAKFFRSGATNNIFCFIPTLKGGNFNEYVAGILNEAEKFNSKVIIEIYDYSLKKEEEILISCLSFNPQGIILVGLEHTIRTKKILRQCHVPVVETWDTSDRPIDKLVGFSHYRLGYDITEQMLKKYKNILFVKSNYSSAKGDYVRGEKKFIGYRDRILKEKRKVYSISINSLDFLQSGKEIISFLKKNKKDNIDCIICDEICALGAIYEANQNKIKLPKELAIAGIGNSQTAQLSSPTLTTVDINAYQIGQKAVSQIFDFDNNIVTDTGYLMVNGESA
tara:strand:- start:186 stop:1196 length:1011 start_codon:yes stop_codon:yes gene_type:complete